MCINIETAKTMQSNLDKLCPSWKGYLQLNFSEKTLEKELSRIKKELKNLEIICKSDPNLAQLLDDVHRTCYFFALSFFVTSQIRKNSYDEMKELTSAISSEKQNLESLQRDCAILARYLEVKKYSGTANTIPRRPEACRYFALVVTYLDMLHIFPTKGG